MEKNTDIRLLLNELPVYNSFSEQNKINWLQKHVISLIFCITAITGFSLYNLNWNFFENARNRMYDEMAVTVVDFGDFVPIQKRKPGASFVEIDEVFGNQYIKDKDKEFDPDRDIVDPRIGTAVNPVMSNATAPVDLNPEIMPEYTPRARSAGAEGTIILELIISDDGKVLRARAVGKKIGHGLEQMAIECYEQKRFKPSVNSDGKPITVKIYQPVRFTLI